MSVADRGAEGRWPRFAVAAAERSASVPQTALNNRILIELAKGVLANLAHTVVDEPNSSPRLGPG